MRPESARASPTGHRVPIAIRPTPRSSRRRSRRAGSGRRRRSRPCSTASTSASGIDAELVLPVRSITDAIRPGQAAGGTAAASMIRRLAWWGTNRAMSSMRDLGPLHRGAGRLDRHPDGLAEDLLTAHDHPGAVIGVQQRHQRPVHAEVPAEQGPFAGHGLDHAPRRRRRRTGRRCCDPPSWWPGSGSRRRSAAPGPCRRRPSPAAVTRP